MRSLPILEATPQWALLGAPRLVVSVWRAHVTVSAVAAIERAVEDVLRESSDRKYASITVIEKTVSMSFDDTARQASANLMKRFGASHCAHGYLVDGDGFLPAAVRTATAGLALMTRAPYPTRVFSKGGELVEWIAPIATLSRDDVLRAIAQARAATGSAAPALSRAW
ncbi:hypothetical protein [Sandaracinus amylolyticus]|uniref:Uncharacterized protein n=1 Tax=Sandaracinus amylolyticus TaxID=927083 RepID=A0A0F6YIZ3_9BACT|nr:hypothetical protein [Sandaracinus amylolyticus]AKF06322.1 hypothetical protein DB32_003471 [Sandaracinus amylolyticus]